MPFFFTFTKLVGAYGGKEEIMNLLAPRFGMTKVEIDEDLLESIALKTALGFPP